MPITKRVFFLLPEGWQMPSNLLRIPFTEDLLAKVQGFDCGEEPWQREVSDWIKAPLGSGGALDELGQGARVWLYVTQAGELVGFGSLAATMQRWPRSKDPQVPASVIPMLGVDRRFWGQPPRPPEERYSAQLLDDLLAEAKRESKERPILILYVHIDNVRGIRFYERAGFVELHKPFTDKKTGRQYKRMVLVLTDSSLHSADTTA
jgi:ribosomal protein S18 acetylase RimI-like enzyme